MRRCVAIAIFTQVLASSLTLRVFGSPKKAMMASPTYLSIVAPCSVGSLQPELHPGEFVVIDQLVDRTAGRPDTFHDVGSGDGQIMAFIAERRPDLTIRGLEVRPRERSPIPVDRFDGRRIPFDDASFDVVTFVDVLHHTDDPMELLRESRRVARRAILIKDHTREGLLARETLRFMDWVGNRPHGVRLPYNYWSEARWSAAWKGMESSGLPAMAG